MARRPTAYILERSLAFVCMTIIKIAQAEFLYDDDNDDEDEHNPDR